jgi:hypothetical protein
MIRPSPCEAANPTRPAAVSFAVIAGLCRRLQIAMHGSPAATSTAPPAGREPLATATP